MQVFSISKNIIIDIIAVILIFFVSMGIYYNNSYSFEKKVSTDLIKSYSLNLKRNYHVNIVDILWMTDDFEKWVPCIYDSSRYNEMSFSGNLHPNMHSTNIKSITISYKDLVFTSWIRKNSFPVVARFFLIPFLSLAIFFIILKILLVNLLSFFIVENSNDGETESTFSYENERRGYNLTKDELEGLLRDE